MPIVIKYHLITNFVPRINHVFFFIINFLLFTKKHNQIKEKKILKPKFIWLQIIYYYLLIRLEILYKNI